LGCKGIDLAELESKAFKFMVLQKPYFNKGTTHLNSARICQASFLPTNIGLPEELKKAFETTNVFRKLLNQPEKVNALKYRFPEATKSRLNYSAELFTGAQSHRHSPPPFQGLKLESFRQHSLLHSEMACDAPIAEDVSLPLPLPLPPVSDMAIFDT